MSKEELIIGELRIDEETDDEQYYSRIPAIRSIKEKPLTFNSKVTFLVGENGSGKSTIIEALAIAAGFNPEGGSRNYAFATNNSHSDLFEHITLVKRRHVNNGYFLRAESFYNVATKEEEYARLGPGLYIPKEFHRKSHGEAFLALAKDFHDNGLYILDEPEAALSPSRLMALMCIIRELEDSSQFIIATHSPILMAYPGAQIIELNEDGICEKDYRDTEHYRITHKFISDPDRMFQLLFDKEKEGND